MTGVGRWARGARTVPCRAAAHGPRALVCARTRAPGRRSRRHDTSSPGNGQTPTTSPPLGPLCYGPVPRETPRAFVPPRGNGFSAVAPRTHMLLEPGPQHTPPRAQSLGSGARAAISPPPDAELRATGVMTRPTPDARPSTPAGSPARRPLAAAPVPWLRARAHNGAAVSIPSLRLAQARTPRAEPSRRAGTEGRIRSGDALDDAFRADGDPLPSGPVQLSAAPGGRSGPPLSSRGHAGRPHELQSNRASVPRAPPSGISPSISAGARSRPKISSPAPTSSVPAPVTVHPAHPRAVSRGTGGWAGGAHLPPKP